MDWKDENNSLNHTNSKQNIYTNRLNNAITHKLQQFTNNSLFNNTDHKRHKTRKEIIQNDIKQSQPRPISNISTKFTSKGTSPTSNDTKHHIRGIIEQQNDTQPATDRIKDNKSLNDSHSPRWRERFSGINANNAIDGASYHNLHRIQSKVQIYENAELRKYRIAAQAIDGNRIDIAWAHYIDNTELIHHEIHHIMQQRLASICHQSSWITRIHAEHEANKRHTLSPCGDNILYYNDDQDPSLANSHVQNVDDLLTEFQFLKAIRRNGDCPRKYLTQLESVLNIKIKNNIFTPEHIKHIARFQKIVNLPVTGIYDRDTRNAMYYIHIYKELSRIQDYKLDKYFAISQMAIESGHVIKSNMGGIKKKCNHASEGEWTTEYYSEIELERKAKEISNRIGYEPPLDKHIKHIPGNAKNGKELYKVRNCFQDFDSSLAFLIAHQNTIESIVKRNCPKADQKIVDKILADGMQLADAIQQGRFPYATSQNNYSPKIKDKMKRVKSIVELYLATSYSCNMD